MEGTLSQLHRQIELPGKVLTNDLSRISPVAIIGMHRSGTSCLAGCLEEQGLHLGCVITSAPHNKKGNRENPRLWPVHDAVLARVGAAWDSPPTVPIAWTAGEIDRLREVLDSYGSIPGHLGFKDPRATLLLDGWFQVLPKLRLVASVRHPLAVARSLFARNGFTQEHSLSIWATYCRAVLRWRRITDFMIIDFDDPRYEFRVRRAAAEIGLPGTVPMNFREEVLNHQKVHGEVPASVAALWDELLAAAAQ